MSGARGNETPRLSPGGSTCRVFFHIGVRESVSDSTTSACSSLFPRQDWNPEAWSGLSASASELS